jgi:two-component system, cell cycle response regulator CpdR
MNMRILVAEDSDSYALLYKTSLETRGHQVEITKDGMECIYKYVDESQKSERRGEDKNPFDLVILDHQMPRMKGLDVAKEILEFNPKQRILIVTAHVKTMMEGIRKLGNKIEVLTKPFPSLAMIRQVEGLARFRWNQKLAKGMKEWDGETGLSEPI